MITDEDRAYLTNQLNRALPSSGQRVQIKAISKRGESHWLTVNEDQYAAVRRALTEESASVRFDDGLWHAYDTDGGDWLTSAPDLNTLGERLRTRGIHTFTVIAGPDTQF